MKLSEFHMTEEGMLEGVVQALGIAPTNVVSQPVRSRDGGDYLLLLSQDEVAPYEVGRAWPQEKNGMQYFSVSIDSPLLPEPINAALFPDQDVPNKFNLVWNRFRKQEPAANVMPANKAARHSGGLFAGIKAKAPGMKGRVANSQKLSV